MSEHTPELNFKVGVTESVVVFAFGKPIKNLVLSHAEVREVVMILISDVPQMRETIKGLF